MVADPTRRDVAAGALGAGVVALAGGAGVTDASAEAGAPARNLYLFLYRPGPSWRAGVPMQEQGLAPHGAYMQRLLDEGRLFAAGGFVDVDGGMAVVIAPSPDEAEAWLAADPAIVSGIFQADIRHWRPRFSVSAPLP